MIAVAIDVILVLIVIEGLALVLFHARTGYGPSPLRLLPNLAAGFLLMGALRVALGAEMPSAGRQVVLAAILAAALLAHLADLAGRWRA